ncbi:hypothetical protein MAIC_30590 [Mycolicibacterium aichiense]|uniref:Uncharacterized protein n=1 Tax=Mycolicibacterium aichiense TaxID=1799 RepID=A0AAD1HS19_9MYCO|nr:hypothetical protein MAIC_30590 [Mycolicibacterium aichiense]
MPDVILAGPEPVLPDSTAANGRVASATTATDHRRRGLANRCFPTDGTLPGQFRRTYTVRYLLDWCPGQLGDPETLLSNRGRGARGSVRIGARVGSELGVHLLFTEPNPDRYCRRYRSLDQPQIAAITS